MHDDPGLAAFCDDLHPRLVAMLELYVNDISVAEELAQESLIRVCQHWRGYGSCPTQKAGLSR